MYKLRWNKRGSFEANMLTFGLYSPNLSCFVSRYWIITFPGVYLSTDGSCFVNCLRYRLQSLSEKQCTASSIGNVWEKVAKSWETLLSDCFLGQFQWFQNGRTASREPRIHFRNQTAKTGERRNTETAQKWHNRNKKTARKIVIPHKRWGRKKIPISKMQYVFSEEPKTEGMNYRSSSSSRQLCSAFLQYSHQMNLFQPASQY